jgi:hypothetical protein
MSEEHWNINKAVHFNEWANMQKDNFVRLIEAFKDLYNQVFSCSNPSCQSQFQVTFKGATRTGVRGKCGDTNWNLLKIIKTAYNNGFSAYFSGCLP